jgi:hypothetical protein
VLNDRLVKLILDHGSDFAQIPDDLIPVVRRLLMIAAAAEALACAELAEQVETGHYTTTKTVAQVLRAYAEELQQ